MTNEELLGMFPECEKIKREDIAECVIKVMNEERFYSKASEKVYHRAYELYPQVKGKYDEKDPEQNARRLYFYGDPWEGIKSPLNEWIKTMEQEFIDRYGEVHTFDEACGIAADEWMRMIFGTHIQDNGDKSDAGGMAMMMGTTVKEEAKKGYGDDVISKARNLMKDYYLNDCIPEENRGKSLKWPRPPYCDYGPNQELFDILVRAGCSERDASNMCPWKTGIEIDRRDNSVRVRGYQTARYL